MPAPNLNPTAYLKTNPDGTTVVAQNAILRCPKELPREAKAVWRKVVPQLQHAGLLSEGDIIQLANLCWHQAVLERAMAQFWEEGPMIRSTRLSVDADGKRYAPLILNPLAPFISRTQVLVNKLTEQFGLTLRARAAMGDVLRNGNVDRPSDQDESNPLAAPNPRFSEDRLN